MPENGDLTVKQVLLSLDFCLPTIAGALGIGCSYVMIQMWWAEPAPLALILLVGMIVLIPTGLVVIYSLKSIANMLLNGSNLWLLRGVMLSLMIIGGCLLGVYGPLLIWLLNDMAFRCAHMLLSPVTISEILF